MLSECRKARILGNAVANAPKQLTAIAPTSITDISCYTSGQFGQCIWPRRPSFEAFSEA